MGGCSAPQNAEETMLERPKKQLFEENLVDQQTMIILPELEAEREADGYAVMVQGSRRALSASQEEQKR